MSREHKSKEKLHTLDAAPFKKILIVGRIIPMPYFVGSRAVLDVVCRCCSRLLYVMNLGHDSNLSNTSMKDGRNATRRVHVQQSRRPESNLHHCAAGRIFSAGQWSSASEPEQLRFSAKNLSSEPGNHKSTDLGGVAGTAIIAAQRRAVTVLDEASSASRIFIVVI